MSTTPANPLDDNFVNDLIERFCPEGGSIDNETLVQQYTRRVVDATAAKLKEATGDNPETFEKLADEKRWG
jgi:hypothetical protein